MNTTGPPQEDLLGTQQEVEELLQTIEYLLLNQKIRRAAKYRLAPGLKTLLLLHEKRIRKLFRWQKVLVAMVVLLAILQPLWLLLGYAQGRGLNLGQALAEAKQAAMNLISPSVEAVGSGSSIDQWGNPTNQALIAYARANQDGHPAPAEWIVSICQYETGSAVHRTADGLKQGVNKDDKGNVISVDWGMCQINDTAHSDKMDMAKSLDWRQNLEAGWQVLDSCWSKYQTEYDRVWCYNGYGKNAAYPERVVAVHDSKFWLTVEEPYVKLAWPGGSRETFGFGTYPETPSFKRLGLVGNPHNGADFVQDAEGGAMVPFDVSAVVDGMVTNVQKNDPGVGGIVEIVPIWDPTMLVSYYHLNSDTIAVQEGDAVLVGMPLGEADGSGSLSDGPHLHLEVKFNGVAVDPMQYMEAAP